MGSYTWILISGLALLAGHACFDQTGSSNGGCPDGSAGCDCYGNGSCDTNLQCTENDKCVDPGCTQGELNCTCSGGLCLGDLECTAFDICRPGAGTESDTTAGTGSAVCEPEVGDNLCAMCAKSACCDETVACLANPICKCLTECLEQGGEDCEMCGALPPEFEQAAECVGSNCVECEPACNPPDSAPACTHCAAENCCRDLDKCSDSPACSCMEPCLAGGDSPAACLQSCGLSDGTEIPELGDLQTCAAAQGCTHEGGDNPPPCYG